MRNLTLYVLLFGFLVLAYLGWRANPTRQPADPIMEDAEMTIGIWIYDRDCAECHTTAFGNSSLASFQGNRQDFESVLSFGPSPMPSFDGEFDERERDALWTYVSSLRD